MLNTPISLLQKLWPRRTSAQPAAANPLPGPDAVTIELSGACNLRCTMCTYGEPSRKIGTMSLPVLQRLAPQLAGVRLITLNLLGEPFLHPHFPEMLRTLREHCPTSYLQMTSNATVLGEESARLLLENGLDRLYISLDGATEETLARIRKGATLETIRRNVTRLVELRNAAGSSRPEICINFLLMTTNAHELPRMIDLAADMGVDAIHVNGITPFDADSDRRKMWDVDGEFPGITHLMRRCARHARQRGVHIIFPLFTAEPVRACSLTNPVISWDGRVSPCFMMFHQRTMVFNGEGIPFPGLFFGNVTRDSLDTVWNDSGFRQFREDTAAGNIQECCKRCTFTMRVLPPLRTMRG